MRATGVVVSAITAIAAYAQAPAITPHSIVNAASLVNPALPGGAIARGSVFSISGQNLGPAVLAQPSALPYATALAGVSIKITQGATAVDAIPISAIANNITAIMPSNAPLGLASVQVTNTGLRSNPSPVTIVDSSFGAYANAFGQGPGSILNVNGDDSQSPNSPSAPALPGQVVILSGTGLGPATFPDNDTPVAGDLPAPVEIFVGGVVVTDKRYSGRGGAPGVDQIIFAVPNDAPLGCWVPVQVRTGGAILSNAVTLAISADGSPCAEPSNVVGQQLLSGGAIGVVGLTRAVKRVGIRHPADQTVDLATISLRQENASPLPFNPLFSLPPAGSCTVYSTAGDLLGADTLPGAAPSGKYLNGGSSSVTGQGAPQTIQNLVEPLPLVPIGGKLPVGKKNTLVLNAGNASVQTTGGPDVGAFQVSAPAPAAITWTNQNQILRVDRTKPLTLNWTGSPDGSTVVALGVNSDQSSNASAAFLCVAQAGATSLTVPDYVLGAVPASRQWPFKSLATIFLGALPLAAPVPFTATGLDLGAMFPVAISAKQVVFR